MTKRSQMRFLLYLQTILLFLFIGCSSDEQFNDEQFNDETNTAKISLNEYFPLKIGNSWEYEVSVSDRMRVLPEVDKIKLVGVEDIANEQPEQVVNNAAVPDVTRATFFYISTPPFCCLWKQDSLSH